MSDQCLIGIINEEEEAVDKKYDDGASFLFYFFRKNIENSSRRLSEGWAA